MVGEGLPLELVTRLAAAVGLRRVSEEEEALEGQMLDAVSVQLKMPLGADCNPVRKKKAIKQDLKRKCFQPCRICERVRSADAAGPDIHFP